MKIVFEMADFNVGGVQKVSFNLVNYFVDAGYDVDIIIPRIGDISNYYINPAVTIHYVPQSLFNRVKYTHSFLKRYNKPVIYFSYYKLNKLRWVASLLSNVSIIHVQHNIVKPSLGERASEFFLKRLKRTHYVSVSNAVKNYYVKEYNIPLEKIQTIYNGVDITSFCPVGNKKDKPFRVVSIGRVTPQKGFDYFIDVAQKYLELKNESTPDMEFVIVGDGIDREMLEKKARKIDPDGKVINFAGERSDISVILQNSSVLASTIRYGGFEIVLAEAMACGIPVVGFDVGPVKEVIAGDEKIGVVVPFEDTLAFYNELLVLVTDSKEYLRRSKLSRQRAEEKFSMEVFCENYNRLVVSIMNEKEAK